jgi:hypothetical protein
MLRVVCIITFVCALGASAVAAQDNLITLQRSGVVLSVSLPEGWVSSDEVDFFQAFPGVVISPEPSMLNVDDYTGADLPVYNAGQITMLVSMVTSSDFPDVPDLAKVMDLVNAWDSSFASELGPTEIEATSLAGMPAGIVTVAAENSSVALILVEAGRSDGESRFVIGLALADPAIFAERLPELLAVIDGVEVVDSGVPVVGSGPTAETSDTAAEVTLPAVVDLSSFSALIDVLPGPSQVSDGAGNLLTQIDFVSLADLRGASLEQLTPFSGALEELVIASQTGMESAVGFSLDEIDTVTVYGTVPGRVLMLTGSFDAESIDTALTSSGFVADTVAGFPAYCHPEGCDLGMQVDFDFVNPANPFGGNLGLRPAIVLIEGGDQPDVLIAGRVLPLVEAMVSGVIGESTGALPYAAALADVIESQSAGRTLLGTALFLSVAPLETGRGGVPPYNTLGLAAFDDGYTLILLHYEDLALAQTAAATFGANLSETSDFADATFASLFERNDIIVGAPDVIETDTGAVVVIPMDDPSGVNAAYNLVIRFLYRRDLALIGWNAAQP